MKSLALCVLLASCASVASPQAPSEAPVEVTSCRPGVPQPPAPPLPRTVESIIKAYNTAKGAGLATETALRECAAKVETLRSLLN